VADRGLREGMLLALMNKTPEREPDASGHGPAGRHHPAAAVPAGS
jgi:hypothetical protein